MAPFFHSFLMTFILSVSICGLALVDYRAQEGGFPSFTDGFSVTYSEPLKMEGRVFSRPFSYSLDSLNDMAEQSDITEPLLIPRSIRFTNRILLNLVNAYEKQLHEQKEEDYIQNAGLI